MAKLLAIVGETASGKSVVAMELARKFDGELVCADSLTVYRGFDVGAAKPTPEERREIRHHMLDVADAADGFSVAAFKTGAKQAIADCTARGKLPILVGGSGLYIDSVLFDYTFIDSADPAERERLSAMSTPELITYATELGLDLAGVDAQNSRRIIRHIENRGAKPARAELRADTIVIGLRLPRDVLTRQVTDRVDAMLAAGLQAEALALAETYGWEAEPMKSIGYREWRTYQAEQADVAQVRDEIIRHTLQLAKKQRTWFKRNISIHWVDDPSKAVDIATTLLNK